MVPSTQISLFGDNSDLQNALIQRMVDLSKWLLPGRLHCFRLKHVSSANYPKVKIYIITINTNALRFRRLVHYGSVITGIVTSSSKLLRAISSVLLLISVALYTALAFFRLALFRLQESLTLQYSYISLWKRHLLSIDERQRRSMRKQQQQK